MPDQNFDAPEISPFKRDQLNPFYLLARLLYTDPGKNTYIRKKIAKEIIEILKEEYHIKINLEDEIELNDTFEAFIQKSKERIKRYKIENTNAAIKACFHERHGIVLSTIHGVKGEEYTTVIAFGLLNGYLPHWD